MENSLDSAVLELLELSKLDGPSGKKLIDMHRRRLVKKLVDSNKIDEDTANYLNE